MAWGYDAMGQPVAPPPPAPPPQPRKGPGTGITALVLCAIAGVGHILLATPSSVWLGMVLYGDTILPDSTIVDYSYRLVGAAVGQVVLGLINLAGIIVAIVAMASGRGRIAGAIGLALGIVLPALAFIWFGIRSGIIPG